MLYYDIYRGAGARAKAWSLLIHAEASLFPSLFSSLSRPLTHSLARSLSFCIARSLASSLSLLLHWRVAAPPWQTNESGGTTAHPGGYLNSTSKERQQTRFVTVRCVRGSRRRRRRGPTVVLLAVAAQVEFESRIRKRFVISYFQRIQFQAL